jgi:AraC-like DNA-binding protein
MRHSCLSLTSQQDHKTLQLTLTVDLPKDAIYRFNVDFVFSAMANLAFEFTKDKSAIGQINFSYPRPNNIEPYIERFGENIDFDTDQNIIQLNLAVVEKAFTASEPSLLTLAIKRCDALLKHITSSDRSIADIKAVMMEDDTGFPTQTELATKLNMSRRSLIRKFAKSNTSYRELLQACQRERAEYLLSQSNDSIERIAEQLSYNNAMSFSRAFKKWSGVSPSLYRKNAMREK